ncbi:MAG: CusA/CzcA family heavy metal efflux RND transporter [Muribaculaceae bacterium]|nr:CusA/CzcA family heavy metal efflux RND transporter [Muribaculaceae bacterium]
MLNRIIHWSLHNRLVVLVLAIAILVGGTAVLLRTEVDIFPDLNAPTVVVMTEAPGYAPEEVEMMVTYPIETAVNGASGVRRVRSTSTTGFSVVWVEFDWDTDVYQARQIVTERLGTVAEALPAGVSAPVLGPRSSILGEMLIVGLTADSTSLMELRTLAEKVIRPRLLAMGGVSQVSVIGGDMREYRVQLLPERMAAMDVTMAEVMEAVEAFNDNASGGIVNDFGNEYIIKGAMRTTDTEELALAVVRADARGIVTLGDVAQVEIAGAQPRFGAASVEAVPAVIITVAKQPDEGTIELTERIKKALDDMRPTLPADLHMHTDIFRQSDFISRSIGNLKDALLEGALFVVIVLFFFLMNLRTTLVSLVAIPLSIIATVVLLHFMGFGINTMSLGGIAIAIGSLVDDAIVDVENVYKRLRENRALPEGQRRSVIEVVFQASAEVRMPILNSTLIIVAAFLPLFFLNGIEGRMLIPLGVAFIVALAASTIVALTLTPVLCAYLLGSPKQDAAMNREPRTAAWLKSAYSRSLAGALRSPRVVLGATSVLFAVAIALFFTLGRSFLPSFNEGSFTINIAALPGISLEESDRLGREAEKIIMSVPEIRTVARKTGRAELDEHSLGVNASEIEAPYSLEGSGRTRGQVARELREKLSELPGVNVEIGQPISHRIDAMLSGTEAQIAVKIFGDDLQRLHALGTQLKGLAAQVPGVVDANVEQLVERPELEIRPRREIMARLGLRMPDLRRIIEVALGGTAVSQVYEGGVPFDIVVVLDPAYRSDVQSIADMMIDTPAGRVPLSTVAELRSSSGPGTINRENVQRRIIVSANVEGRDLRGAVEDLQRLAAEKMQLPQGYAISYGGQFESEARASATLLWTSLLALVIIFMLLYGEFHDVRQSLVILINMPLALIGAVFILVLTGSELNIPAIIGFISLMGIATRNGMLLISRYNHLRDEGMSVAERVRTGSADRLLPIIMTALTSALALIPLAVNADAPGNEIQAPLAIVILGGLASSTVLNAYVVPVLYTLINRKKK